MVGWNLEEGETWSVERDRDNGNTRVMKMEEQSWMSAGFVCRIRSRIQLGATRRNRVLGNH